MQLLDALAGQVDRNPSNFYIDDTGPTLKFILIDNDMSFGGVTNPVRAVQAYPGLSKYVDKDLAEAIGALDEAALKTQLGALLTADEITALTSRFTAVKQHLATAEKIDRNGWDGREMEQKLMAEDKSYFAGWNRKYKK
jgi:hypothetical protein